MSGTVGKCRRCGRTIVWVECTVGKLIPLDPMPQNMAILVSDHGEDERVRIVAGRVVHSLLCMPAKPVTRRSGREARS